MNYEGQCCSIHEYSGNIATACLIFVLLVDKQDCEVLIEEVEGKQKERKETLSTKVKLNELDRRT